MPEREDWLKELEARWERASLRNPVLHASLKHAREMGLSDEQTFKFAVANLAEQNAVLLKQATDMYWKNA